MKNKNIIIKKLVIITSVIVIIFSFLEFIPHTHLDTKGRKMEQISMNVIGERIVLNKPLNVRILGYLIQSVKLYSSDLSALPASPEKFVSIRFDDDSTISVNSMGGYCLISYKKEDVSSVELYQTNFFWIDFIYGIANMIK